MSAARSSENVLIRASAGTGKTYQLSNRYLGLVAAGHSPDAILATTFTRKAAGEILDRVLVRLAEAALDEAKRRELAAAIQDKALARGRLADMLAALVGNLHRLRVSTLDAYFNQVAGSFALELGLPPAWRIVDELEDDALRQQAIAEVLAGQSAAEASTLMHLLSKGEVKRGVGEQIRGQVDALYSLFQEASKEAFHGVPRTKPLDEEALQVALAELLAAPIPDKRFKDPREKDVQKILDADWVGLLRSGLAAKLIAGETTYHRKAFGEKLIAAYEPLIDHARARLLESIANQTEAAWRLLATFDERYRRLKRTRGAMGFADVTHDLAQAGESGLLDLAGFRLDARVEHLLLDEFQDTSQSQWRVLRPLARQIAEAAGERSLFCVGDVKQAIFGWRGGEAEIFDTLAGEIAGLQEQTLSESYRSSQVVLDVVNTVFGSIAGYRVLADDYQRGAAAWAGRFQQHTAHKRALAGYACLRTVAPAAEGQKQEVATLRYAAGYIRDLVQATPDRTIGVLVRRNDSVGRLIYELRELGVAASEEGGNPLADSPAVQLVLSLLHLADHPGDTVAAFHVAHSPLGKAVGLAAYDDPAQRAAASRHVRGRLADDGYGPTVYDWARVLAPVCSPRDMRRLGQLVERAYAHQSEAGLRTAQFVEAVRAQRAPDPSDANVRVMTFHQAKGLEFDIVVLPELDVNLVGQSPVAIADRPRPGEPINLVCSYFSKELIPLLPQKLRRLHERFVQRQVEEALCVLYVALTRPVHALHMLIAPSATNERSIRKSFAGVLRCALTDGAPNEPEELLWEAGRPDWYVAADRGAPSEIPPRPPQPAMEAVTKVPLAPGRQRRRGLSRRSPSEREGGPRVFAADLLSLEAAAALGRGTLVHLWCERIEWLDDESDALDEAALRQAAAEMDTTGVNVDEALVQFTRMLAQRNIAAVLRRSWYTDPAPQRFPAGMEQALGGASELLARRERRFLIREGDEIVPGSIDRLVLVCRDGKPRAAEVLDFKTDRLGRDDPSALEQRVDYYRPQLDAYRRAVATNYGLRVDCISARLLFLEPGVAVPC